MQCIFTTLTYLGDLHTTGENTRRDINMRLDIPATEAKSIEVEAYIKTVTTLENPSSASARVSLPLVSKADVTVFG
jgi:hypothetical protein